MLIELPPEIGSMTSLQSLYVNSNKLTYLPYELVYLPNLWFLDISYNQIGYISPDLLNKPGLYVFNYGQASDDRTDSNIDIGEVVYTIFSTGWDVKVQLDYKDNAYTAMLTESTVGEKENLFIKGDGNFGKADDKHRYISHFFLPSFLSVGINVSC